MSAFEDDNEAQNTRLNIKNQPTKSIFDNKDTRQNNKKQFEQQASVINDRLNSYPERSAELIPLFLKLLENKTLIENKTILETNLETDIIAKLSQLALDMDEDKYEHDGAGSVGLCILLMKCLLLQRDRINSIEYAITQSKLEIKQLKEKVAAMPLDKQSNNK